MTRAWNPYDKVQPGFEGDAATIPWKPILMFAGFLVGGLALLFLMIHFT